MINKAAFVVEKQKMEIMDSPMPEMKPGYVKVNVEYCGICGSDMYHFTNLEMAWYPDIYPFIIGHEFAGTVVEVADDVTSLKVGDRVCVEPGTFCGKCEHCTEGRYNLCESMEFLSAPPVHGAMREYITHPAELCYKLPDNVSTLEGALIEPLAVGMNAVRRSGIRIGQSAVVMGTGCIGLVTIMSLKAAGITDITAVDLFDIRLNKALEVGATRVVNTKDKDAVKAVLDAVGGKGPDFVFETAGNRNVLASAVFIVKRGGTVVQVGNIGGEVQIQIQHMMDSEKSLITSFRYKGVYKTCVDAVAAGCIDVKSIVSKIYPLDDVMTAFDECINNKMNMIKGVLKIKED